MVLILTTTPDHTQNRSFYMLSCYFGSMPSIENGFRSGAYVFVSNSWKRVLKLIFVEPCNKSSLYPC
jgi:hypothetical protein